ncbi:hypothetical protein MHU86_17336 [Fragilaria crotonensis]|nr:hypothetical protein MHU86_17336 [Fragilaria crotonensis]
MTSRPRYMTPTKASKANRVRTDSDSAVSKTAPMMRPKTTTTTETTAAMPTTVSTPSTQRRASGKTDGFGSTEGSTITRRKSHPEGVRQAQQLVEYQFDQGHPELVVSSPLTRALHTAILGFPDPEQRILIHYDLAEVGSRVPENTPRPIQKVLKDLEATDRTIDAKTLLPDTWPAVLYDGKNNRGKAIRRAMQYLFAERMEETIAVVCHYNVIREILEDGAGMRPQNATPIPCELYANGQVKQKVEGDDAFSEPRKRLDYC